jgi:isoleucyl-tRNA synthetase
MTKKTDRPFFDPVDPKVDFARMEVELLEQWYKKGVVKKYLQKNRSSKKYFSFMDGPITANNPMGVHHAWGRTYKDLWRRYKNMQGYRQRFQNGFDCQGLWVEVEVEKELGFKTKKDIEEYGVAKFVQKCKDRVMKYSGIQTEQTKRLGNFMDWDNSYFTMSDENNYMIWHFLKTCHEHGWLYKGNESVPWCPRCETAISQHEILTENYKEVSHESITLEFPIEGKKNEYLLVWTTTPWTIPANIAIAIDKKIDYSLVEGKTGDRFWLASKTVNRVFGKGKGRLIRKVKGKKLVGLKYRGPYDHLPAVAEVAGKNPDTFHLVVATDDRLMPISVDEGTGMVHTAVSAGTEDFRLGKKLGLPMIPVIADNADYLSGLGALSGKNAKKHPEIILDYLKDEDKKPGIDWVFDVFMYKHRYPSCWRCKEELVWKVTDEWYIAMDRSSRKFPSKKNKGSKHSKMTLRDRMIGVAKKIRWIPEFGLKRELDWLNNMHDWLISKKNRYWGLALPIWECNSCKNFEVIGSKEELKEKAVVGWEKFERKSPHKPQIDEIKLKCPKCKKEMSRIEPVGNPWLDAGIVPYSTISADNKSQPLYKKDREEWKKWFPVDFITEGFPGQFKNWFYSLIAMSSVLENETPTRTILGHEDVWAEDGRPMHKSWGNATEFNEGAEEIGADVMRWMFAKQAPAEKILFGRKLADQTRRSFHLMLWNVYRFFVTYANLDGWYPEMTATKKVNVQKKIDLWAFTRLYETLRDVTKFLDDYNAKDATEAIEAYVSDLSLWYVRRSRGRVGANSSDELDKNNFYFTLSTGLHYLCEMIAPFTPFLADEIFKNINPFAKKMKSSVHLGNWPSQEALKDLWEAYKSLITDMMLVRKIVELGHSKRKSEKIPVRQPLLSIEVASPQKKLDVELLQLTKDELNVKDVLWKKGKELAVELDTKVTPKLQEEGKARELVRNIQNERRTLGFGLEEKVEVTSEWLPKRKKLVENIKRVTLAERISIGKFEVKRFS